MAQKLCHEAESAIDEADSDGRPFPVDAILGLIDWMKGYVSQLADDLRAKAPAHEDLLRQLTGNRCPEPTSDDPTPATGPSAPEAREDVDDDGPVDLPSDLDSEENLGDFLCEAREHIAAAEQALLGLEDNFQEIELINTVFRAFHTIKGVAGFMNLTAIVKLAHSAEALLDQARNNRITLNSAYLDLILNSCDMLLELIGALEGAPSPTKRAHAALIGRLETATEGRDIEPPATEPTLPYPPLGEILVDMHIISPQQVAEALDRQAEGARRLRDLLVEVGHTDADTVEAALLEPNSSTGKQIYEMIIELGLVKSQELDTAIEAKRDSDKRIGQLLELSSKQLAPALRKQRQMRREANVESTTVTATIPTTRPTGSSSTGANKATASSHRRGDQTVKVNTTRMDILVNMVGELVIAQQMVVQDPSIQALKAQRIQRNLTHAGKIIRDLQEVAMSLRMVTVKGTFQKMSRLVRDLAKKSGKRIQFHMEGEDTEL